MKVRVRGSSRKDVMYAWCRCTCGFYFFRARSVARSCRLSCSLLLSLLCWSGFRKERQGKRKIGSSVFCRSWRESFKPFYSTLTDRVYVFQYACVRLHVRYLVANCNCGRGANSPSRFCSCSLAFLDPRVGHTMDVLSPFISILCGQMAGWMKTPAQPVSIQYCYSVRLSRVRPSVCPSLAGIVSKRLKRSLNNALWVATEVSVFSCQTSCWNFSEITPTGTPNTGVVVKIGDFQPISHYASEPMQDRCILLIEGK